jgi:hypothetical protein
MLTTHLEHWSVHIALCERKLVDARLNRLLQDQKSAWHDREISELRRDLVEIDGVIAKARSGLH